MSNRRPHIRQVTAALSCFAVAILLLAPSLSIRADQEPQPTSADQPQPEPQPVARPESALERLRPFADFRFRYEHDLLKGRPDRDRSRIRFRLGATFGITDDVLVGARLVTGNREDPNSTHQTLGDLFRDFEVGLDRAFLNWRPGWKADPRLTVGKFAHPFDVNPIYGELVWDADVQPEGLLAELDWRDFGVDSLTWAIGGYFVLETRETSDASVAVTQPVVRQRLSEGLNSSWALGYYYYSNLTPGGETEVVGVNRGNAVVDLDGDGVPDEYVSEFGILNPVIALTFDRWRYPLVLSAEYILNHRANIDEDQGWAIGLSVGRPGSEARNWLAYYQWQVVQRDAVFSPVAQDDFLQATNYRGHVSGLRYQFLKRVEAHLWALVSRPDQATGGAEDEWRLRLDINTRF